MASEKAASKEVLFCLIDAELKTRLKVAMAKKKQSINSYVTSLLEQNLKED